MHFKIIMERYLFYSYNNNIHVINFLIHSYLLCLKLCMLLISAIFNSLLHTFRSISYDLCLQIIHKLPSCCDIKFKTHIAVHRFVCICRHNWFRKYTCNALQYPLAAHAHCTITHFNLAATISLPQLQFLKL